MSFSWVIQMFLLFLAINRAYVMGNVLHKNPPNEPKGKNTDLSLLHPKMQLDEDNTDGDWHHEPRGSTKAIIGCSSNPKSVTVAEGGQVVLRSPRYPRNYPGSKDCGWQLQGNNPNIRFSVSCGTFVMQNPSGGVCLDYLLLDSQSTFCGTNKPAGWTSSSSTLDISLHSNAKRNYKGFNCWATAYSISPLPETSTANPQCRCGIPNRAVRIVGGVAAEVNEYPWQVAIAIVGTNDFRNFFCGGSIINTRYVLSAAHCGINVNHQVIVGAHSWSSHTPSHRRVSILQVTTHASYNSVTYDNDISLLLLAEFLDFTDVALSPVCLPAPGTASSFAGLKATVTGWGTLRYGTTYFPDVLQEVEIDVVTNSRCTAQYDTSSITDNMLCAGVDQGGKDSCQGDSGGPLVTQENGTYVQIGIVSWGFDCGNPYYFGVYTRLTQYLTWISARVGNYGVCNG